MTDNNKVHLIKELGNMLETIVNGTESEHSTIFTNYLERIYKITKLFMTSIEKEISEVKDNNDSDDENSFKKYINSNDVDSVSEYEDYESGSDNDTENNLYNNDNKKNIYKEALTEFDKIVKEFYDNIKVTSILVIKKID